MGAHSSCWCAFGALALLLAPELDAQETRLLVVAGLGGDAEHSTTFHGWASALLDAALAAGVAPENAVYLGEDPALEPGRIRERSTRENVTAVLAELVAKVGEQDQLWIVLIGHGSSSGSGGRFNLPGPDLTDVDFAQALAPLRGRLAFVNVSSSSGAFLPALSAEHRAIVTATKSGAQREETVFGGHFVAAFAGAKGDLDKDGRVSLLEAFDFAQQEVARHYDSQSLLVTEHAQLDDNGDRISSHDPDALSSEADRDGRLASRLYLGQEALVARAAEDPELERLLRAKLELEERIEALRRQRDSLDEDVYLQELEALLVDLALREREIEARQSAGDAGEGRSGTEAASEVPEREGEG